MKLLKILILIFVTIFFTACSTKKNLNINKEIQSLQVSKKVLVYPISKTVASPVAVNLGVGSYYRHVGVFLGKTFIPRVKNTDALNLQSAINLHNVNLEKIVYNEFVKNIKDDSFYSPRLVPFGANYTIKLAVLDYDISNSMLTSYSTTKIKLGIKIVNRQGNEVYSDTQTASYDFLNSDEIFNNKKYLEQILQKSSNKALKSIINNMKKTK